MSEEIIKVLDALAEKFGLVIDWTSYNVVPYVEQLCGKYVNYEIATSVLWIFLASITIIICMIFLKRHKDFGIDCDDIFFRVLFILAFIGLQIVVIVGEMFDIIACFTFPEKIIFDQLKSIYSSMNQ